MVLRRILIILIFYLIIPAGCESLSQFPNQTLNSPTLEINILEITPTLTPFVPVTHIPAEEIEQPVAFITPTADANQNDLSPSQPVNYHSVDAPAGMNPLTGLFVQDSSLLNRRPILIKVSNYPRSGRPHSCLSFADIVFEYYIGEEANRFLALFYGQNCDKVGPMRSGRLIDGQIVNMYQGLLAYANADPRVDTVLMDELGNRALAFNNTPCPAICGTDSHNVNDVFANTSAITDYANQNGISNSTPDLSGLYFSENKPLSEKFAIQIGVEYSKRDRGEWHYDPSSGRYLRTIEDLTEKNEFIQIPLVDRVTGKQLSFSNIIIMFANYTEYAPTLHAIDVWDNTQGQRAVIFRDGVMIEGSWKSLGHQLPIQFFDSYGLPAVLKPGNTWIVIAGVSSTLNEKKEGQWEMRFFLP